MSFDPLWAPLIGHYRDGALDGARVARQVAHISADVRQFLIGGTTGDGWQIGDDMLRQWLDLVGDPAAFGPGIRVLVAALGRTTEEVVARAEWIEAHFRTHPGAVEFAGLTLCPPVDPDASQDAIFDHFRAVIDATSALIAIYQLPQVTGCEIAPETFARLASGCPRIAWFKDTSGRDRVARSGLGFGRARLVRGAEGDYARMLKPAGPYDGWLLSTANGFAAELRAIADFVADGRMAQAEALSATLSAVVARLFAAADRPGGNPFADANRAVDHVRAHGAAWREHPAPRRLDGSALPAELVAAAEEALAGARMARPPYLG